MRRARSLSIVVGVALAALLLVSLGTAGGKRAAQPAASAQHLVVVPNTPQGQAALAAVPARVVARYGAFTLVETATGVDRLLAAGGDLRDDMRKVKIGTRSSDPTKLPSLLGKTRAALSATGKGSKGLAVVQFVGPVKDRWVAAVRKTGVSVVSYMAQNGYLVSGDKAALAALADLSTRDRTIRAVTPFTAADKLLAGLASSGTTEVVVSTVDGEAGAAATSVLDSVSTKVSGDVPVAGIVQHHVRLDAAQVKNLAQLGGVVAIEPFVAPHLLDERAARIIDGALDASFQPVLGAGHRNFLTTHGFSTSSSVVIDITDEGVDKGLVPVPAGSHPDFYRGGNSANPSRIVYAQESTAGDTDARDCGGHGTNVASIATGFNSLTGAAVEDAAGFNYGVGIQPFGNVGATKIFNCAGSFDVTSSITALHSNAYANGARISNNSWGASTGGAYTSLSQEFDNLVRDAQPTVAGNQQFVEVVAAGNAGAGLNTIGAPGTAKNVITVGASENVRPIGGTDGCGVTDAGANSARDIIFFSSRGPTDDLRLKPDIVAPGTHVTGAQPQTGAFYNGSGTCNPQFPAGSTTYTLVSGTSQATPEITGLSSLLRSWFTANLGGGTRPPSPAMTKALLVNTATDLKGGDDGAGATNSAIPTQTQGWGRANLGTVLNGTTRQAVDQASVLGATGASQTRYYPIASASKPLRVTLAWTDAPGPTVGNSFVNDLNLLVVAGGNTYKGNVFSAGKSVAGGSADPANNVENVYLPAGLTGNIKVVVVGANIAGDGVPGNADTTDQDYALLVSNAGPKVATAPALTDEGHTLTPAGDGDSVLEPGEPFTLAQRLKNVGNATATGISATMTMPASEGTVTQGSGTWPNLAGGATGTGTPSYAGSVLASRPCGTLVHLTITGSSNGGPFSFPVDLPLGKAGAAVSHNSTDVPKSIPDNNSTGVTSTVNVGASGRITDINLTIGSLTHTFDSDLLIDLTSPAGTTVRLFNRHGGSGDNLTNTVFDDQAATSIAVGAAPFTGSFMPFQPLSAYNGEGVHGIWTLTVRDVAALDTGTLNSWSLQRKVYSCS